MNIGAKIDEGIALHQQGQLAEASKIYEAILQIEPRNFDALALLGAATAQQGQFEKATPWLQAAIKQNDKAETVHNNLGNAFQGLGLFDQALASYDNAIRLKPDYADAHYNRGTVLRQLRRFDDSLASIDKAIRLRPDYADAHYNRGNTLNELRRFEEALASYDKAISLDPNLVSHGQQLRLRMQICDWRTLPSQIEKVVAAVGADEKVGPPFVVLGALDSLELHKTSAKVYGDARYPSDARLGRIIKRPRADKKIRIGYYSADFRQHATSHLMAGLFEAHDPDLFELYGFSLGFDAQDDMRRRVSAAFREFIDVGRKIDREVASTSRELGIDIAIDLNGHTKNSRPGIFALRCAPIQALYLGYPGTMAVEYIDYIIADKIVIPDESRSSFTEKIVHLPHSYQVNDSKRKISDRVFTRQELGLPEAGFVFCCFNNNYKILPATFDLWMRVLKAVDGSVLWLLEDNPTAATNLRREAEARGVSAGRLVFANRMAPEAHLARHRAADLFIDTLPYNAHTTASDALWAGLPLLTCMGKSFASRVAASLLMAIDLPELVTRAPLEFEARAIELATDRAQLQRIKHRLAENRLTTPLFDTRLFARHIEAAYDMMYRRYQAGLPPADIEVNG